MKVYTSFLSIFLFLLLLSPFLILISYLLVIHGDVKFFSLFSTLIEKDFLNSFEFTFLQALYSTVLTLLLGFLGGVGLLRVNKSIKKIMISFFLLPNFIPTLFVVLSFFAISSWFSTVFYGFSAIVIVHVAINIGLCSCLFFYLFNRQLSGMANLFYVEGGNFFTFWLTVIKFLKLDCLIVTLFFFALYFTSFSVPLLLSSGLNQTIEVFIYEKILLQGAWAQAVFLSFMQVCLFVFFGVIFHFFKKKQNLLVGGSFTLNNSKGLFYFSRLSFISIPFFSSLLIVLGFFSIVLKSWSTYDFLVPWSLLYYSFLQGFLVGLGVFLLLLLTASLGIKSNFKFFLMFYISPSLVLIGFAYLLFSQFSNFSVDGRGAFISLIVSLSILFWPMFYRLKLASLLNSLEGQCRLAKILGAKEFLIYRKIIFPQILKYISFSSGVAALWACADFSLSLMILPKDISLSLSIHSLLSFYRWDQAAIYSFFLLLLGLFLFYLFNSVVPSCFKYIDRKVLPSLIMLMK